MKLVDPAAITNKLMSFYKSLMDTTLINITAVNKLTIKNEPYLNHAQQLLLCDEVTDEEIYEWLRSTGDDKGLDLMDVMPCSIKRLGQSFNVISM